MVICGDTQASAPLHSRIRPQMKRKLPWLRPPETELHHTHTRGRIIWRESLDITAAEQSTALLCQGLEPFRNCLKKRVRSCAIDNHANVTFLPQDIFQALTGSIPDRPKIIHEPNDNPPALIRITDHTIDETPESNNAQTEQHPGTLAMLAHRAALNNAR